ncbi:hypothetical protein PROFUN_00379 [Planoprotostelium fungivorum]|uniref:SET domain-containing protein n=1 Tax=Planoprotostelium fungivorum TaxID=1890364 RepID=A0A2P6NY75_9EUKA|nr:hypothetical protein PROFUN_00379 [Planoprotostelium fungivorum]
MSTDERAAFKVQEKKFVKRCQELKKEDEEDFRKSLEEAKWKGIDQPPLTPPPSSRLDCYLPDEPMLIPFYQYVPTEENIQISNDNDDVINGLEDEMVSWMGSDMMNWTSTQLKEAGRAFDIFQDPLNKERLKYKYICKTVSAFIVTSSTAGNTIQPVKVGVHAAIILKRPEHPGYLPLHESLFTEPQFCGDHCHKRKERSRTPYDWKEEQILCAVELAALYRGNTCRVARSLSLATCNQVEMLLRDRRDQLKSLMPDDEKKLKRGCSCDDACGKKCLCLRRGEECDHNYCKCKARALKPCGYNDLSLAHRPLTYVVISSIPNAGYGLMVGEEIEGGGYVGEYTGEVSFGLEEDERSQYYKKIKLNYVFSTKSYQIDSFMVGNNMRFINDPNQSSMINCKAENRSVRGEQKTGIWTTRKVKAGEELFLSYGEIWLEHRANTRPTTRGGRRFDPCIEQLLLLFVGLSITF